jgi:hypothetical protein
MATVWAGAAVKRKRGLRILPKGQGYFVHVTSRTVGQSFLFGNQEKRVFVRMMRQWAAFSGLGIITHCLMDNHFHMMLWVPAQVDLEHGEVLSRLEGVWPEEKVQAWSTFYQRQDKSTREAMDSAIRDRMADLPEFMRVLKRSFSCWYNLKEDRKGTLWDARYRSVVIEDSPLALMSVAAYIDLNPFRAGLVDDPMSYAWSGYGSAMGGDVKARKGLDSLIRLSRGHQPFAARSIRKKQLNTANTPWQNIAPILEKERKTRAAPASWKDVQSAYRIWLVNKGESKEDIQIVSKKISSRKGLDPLQVLAEYEQQGAVPLSSSLQSKIRSFSRGVALGNPEFLENLMAEYRSCFGHRRKKAGRRVKPMKNIFYSLRQVD